MQLEPPVPSIFADDTTAGMGSRYDRPRPDDLARGRARPPRPGGRHRGPHRRAPLGGESGRAPAGEDRGHFPRPRHPARARPGVRHRRPGRHQELGAHPRRRRSLPPALQRRRRPPRGLRRGVRAGSDAYRGGRSDSPPGVVRRSHAGHRRDQPPGVVPGGWGSLGAPAGTGAGVHSHRCTPSRLRTRGSPGSWGSRPKQWSRWPTRYRSPMSSPWSPVPPQPFLGSDLLSAGVQVNVREAITLEWAKIEPAVRLGGHGQPRTGEMAVIGAQGPLRGGRGGVLGPGLLASGPGGGGRGQARRCRPVPLQGHGVGAGRRCARRRRFPAGGGSGEGHVTGTRAAGPPVPHLPRTHGSQGRPS